MTTFGQVPSNQVVQVTEDHTTGLEAFSAPVDRLQFSKLIVYGHSLPAGGGASEPDRDIMTHLASMLKMREINRSKGGAILSFNNVGATGDGGFAQVMQYEYRKQATGTTLAAQANSGATTLTLTAAAGFVNGQAIMVGIGDTGASGGEVRFIVSGGGTTTLTLDQALARTHANGQPVYQVTTGNINLNPLYLCWYGLNDLGAFPITSASNTNDRSRYWDTLRAVVARMRCSEVYENDHVSCVYTGTWVAPVAATSTNSGDNIRRITNADNVVTIHVPDNFPGGTVVVGYSVSNDVTTNPVATFTVDGVAAGTLTMYDAFTGKNYATVKRLTGLAPGRHQIVVSHTFPGSTYWFDWWGIEAEQPPIVLLPGMNRPYSYVLWASNTNARRTTTLTGLHGVGTTSWTVGSTANMMVGATVTFEEGGGNAETKEVLTVTDATHFTTAASSLSHAGATSVVYGMQDADTAKYDTLLATFVTEFADGRVIPVYIDATLNKALDYFYSPGTDGAHFTDSGHAVLTNVFYETLMNSSKVLPIISSFTAAPTAPLPCTIPLLMGTVTAADTTWATMPAALTELFGATLGPTYRQRADLRRVFEWRFIGQVKTVGAGTASLRLRYSIDNGTTFKYLGRSALLAEDGTVGALSIITTTGEKDSGWWPLPADAIADNVVLQVMGINGNGVASPVFGNIYVMFR